MAVYNPTGSGNVHVDKILTEISLGWPNNGLVGEQLFPAVTVKKQSDKYYVFGREGWSPEDDLRGPGSIAHEIPGLALSTDTYYAQEHALQIPIPDEERENADQGLTPDRDATELLTSKIMLGRELAMRNMVTTAANYNASNQKVYIDSNTQYDEGAGSTPLADFRLARNTIHSKIFMEPNVALIPWRVMSALEDHTDFISRIQYTERAIMTPEILQSILGIEKVIVPGAGYNTAKAGQSVSLSYIWGDDIVVAYVPPRPGRMIPAFGYEFQWGNQFVDRWREEPRVSDLIRLRRRYDLKMVGVDGSGLSISGFVIKNTLIGI
jgi:hypothetical protein